MDSRLICLLAIWRLGDSNLQGGVALPVAYTLSACLELVEVGGICIETYLIFDNIFHLAA